MKPLAREAGPQIEAAAQKFTQEVLGPAAKQLAEQLEPTAQVLVEKDTHAWSGLSSCLCMLCTAV